jgi:serine/threonine-protein kinase HSL1, negative regulator of Swe1 kinase
VYAVKQFKGYASAIADLTNETRALSSLIHPNIVKMIASDKKNVVLEYLSNGELFEIISTRRMTERVGKFYFKELISALKYAHDNNWVHRDIKLENILVSDDLHL